MKFFITGGTGLIGKRLVAQLAEDPANELVLSSRKSEERLKKLWQKDKIFTPSQLNKMKVVPFSREILEGELPDTDCIINLAGSPIFDQKWTKKYKEELISSREETTQLLFSVVSSLPKNKQPSLIISGSAIGCYGTSWLTPFDESSAYGEDFLADVTKRWEAPAKNMNAKIASRKVILRIGIVLDPGGGMLGKMLTPFKLGVGGKLGSGQQWISWIHRDDLVRLILHIISDENYSGPVNAVNNHPVTNTEFTEELGKALSRPTLIPAPAFGLRALLGERANFLITGQRVSPSVANKNHFEFQFDTLPKALSDLLNKT